MFIIPIGLNYRKGEKEESADILAYCRISLQTLLMPKIR